VIGNNAVVSESKSSGFALRIKAGRSRLAGLDHPVSFSATFLTVSSPGIDHSLLGFMDLNVIEYRGASTGGMLCSQR
jgi:hypothetical protein